MQSVIEPFRKQLISDILKDIKNNRKQKIKEAAFDEKQIQDKYYNGEDLDKQYVIPSSLDRFDKRNEMSLSFFTN